MKISDLKTKELEQACKDYQVKELYIFGSVVSGEITHHSDLDFLVVFNRSGFEGAFDQYMGLKEKLETIYERPVDLIHLKKFRNPLFEKKCKRLKHSFMPHSARKLLLDVSPAMMSSCVHPIWSRRTLEPALD